MNGREWHYLVDGSRVGPISEEELVQKLRSNEIPTDAYVWGVGYEDWVPACEVPALVAQIPALAQSLPILVLRGSKLATSELNPNRILIFHDRIEEHDRGFLKSSMQALRYSQVAQVSIRSGVMYSELRIESTGGKEIIVSGLKNAQAVEARRIIEQKIDELQSSPKSMNQSPPIVSPKEDFAEQIRKLASLRDEGLLSNDEFAEKKKEILSRM